MTDAELIDALGGPTKLAERLGYPPVGGPQRVSNWRKRGIPPGVKLKWPDLFLSNLRPGAEAASADSRVLEVQHAA